MNTFFSKQHESRDTEKRQTAPVLCASFLCPVIRAVCWRIKLSCLLIENLAVQVPSTWCQVRSRSVKNLGNIAGFLYQLWCWCQTFGIGNSKLLISHSKLQQQQQKEKTQISHDMHVKEGTWLVVLPTNGMLTSWLTSVFFISTLNRDSSSNKLGGVPPLFSPAVSQNSCNWFWDAKVDVTVKWPKIFGRYRAIWVQY